jgi:hypothetical protein
MGLAPEFEELTISSLVLMRKMQHVFPHPNFALAVILFATALIIPSGNAWPWP